MRTTTVLAAVALVLAVSPAVHSGEKPLEYIDLMKFKTIEDPLISADGAWVAFTLKPDRGEYEACVRSVDGSAEYRIPGGAQPVVAKNSAWAASTLMPRQKKRDEAAQKPDAKPPETGMALVNLADGAIERFEAIDSFAFSDDGRWLAFSRKAEENEGDEDDAAEETEEDGAVLGSPLVLRDLTRSVDIGIEHVTEFAFDQSSRFLAYAQVGDEGTRNGLYLRDLSSGAVHTAASQEQGRYAHLVWAEDISRLAFLAAVEDDDHEPGPASVWTWNSQPGSAVDVPAIEVVGTPPAATGWRIPFANELSWSRDGQRLFFGYERIDPVREKRRLEQKAEKAAERAAEGDGDDEPDEPFDPYDIEQLLEEREVDVWHGKDPLIIPHQKERWDEVEKNRRYLAVYDPGLGTNRRLAGLDMPDIRIAENSRAVLGLSSLEYRQLLTWDGEYADVYHVDLRTGERQAVAKKLRDPELYLSPQGRYVVFYRDRHWHLFDADDGAVRNLTESIEIGFANEDDDYPAPDPGYGIADWFKDDSGVIIYDKYDLWLFPTEGGDPVNLTGARGRRDALQFRLVDLDPDQDGVAADASLLLHSFSEHDKSDAFWRLELGEPELRQLLADNVHYAVIAKAEDADRVLFTRESYTEFPDLWVADTAMAGGRRVSLANPQIDEFAWGSAELVHWRSADGIPLEGVLIKPAGFEPGQRYPVLVYFYRFFSQRLHRFNEPVINHRPSFPVYASHGYAVFLPDIRFEIGRPGLSAVKALVPGVQKLVDLGIADPDAIGLHGHSWSGYQAAFVITQTDYFAAAVAGAPVSNMTSAYSGIRLGSGMARQFQYEQSQSRIGGSLDDELFAYIENSPVFQARYIKTPLLIQFGDRDEAVPWQQGIELYLALRRLNKDVVFLQYRDEPHHLKKYPNKLDYSIKMKQFFDHHLKGQPAPDWMTEGVPYLGE